MDARTTLAPFRFLWRRVLRPVFRAADRGLVRVAALFGAMEPDPGRRAARLNGLFLVLYAVGVLPVPWLSLAALLFAYIGVLGVGRAWVANEKVRANIVKKVDDADPDALPDLRGAALMSALHLLIVFPLLLWQLSKHFPGQLFAVPDGASFGSWLEFAFEPYAKFLFDWFEGHTHAADIAAASPAGRFVVLVKRLTLDWILIQGVVRLFAVRTVIAEAVGAVGSHPDITVRLGARAVGPLTELLTSKEVAAPPHVRAQAARVLGQLKAVGAVADLSAALSDPAEEVRWRAAEALGEIRDPAATPALVQAVRDPDPNTARAALDALIATDARDAVPTLRGWLTGTDAPPAARALAAEGLHRLAGKDAVEPLAAALADADEDVGKSAAVALGQIGDARAVGWLGEILIDCVRSVWLRYEVAKALGNLGPDAAPALRKVLGDPDPGLRRLAARNLGVLADPAAGPDLVAALGDAAPEVREAAARAVGAVKAADGPGQLVRLLRDPHAEVRDAAADALVEYGGTAIPAVEAELPAADPDHRARLEDVRQRIGG